MFPQVGPPIPASEALGSSCLSLPSRSMEGAVEASGGGTAVRDRRTTEPLYTYGQAARYLGVPASTFATWARGYERHFPDRDRPVIKGPIITAMSAPVGHPRVPFIGLAEGMVVTAFRSRGLPMQRIRPAVKVLREQIGLEYALASRNLYSDGAEILYDFADRYDEDELHRLVVVRSGQHVFHEVVRDYLERITYDADDDLARRLFLPITKERLIQVDPEVAFGQPLFVHGGAPLDSVRSRVKAGEPIESVARDFEVPEAELREALSAAA